MTRSTDPASSHGWQATPGQPIPRAARQPAANGLLLVMLVLVWFSPPSIVAWLLGQAVILLQRRWHWWRFTLASLAGIGLVLAVTGPQEALRRHVFVPQHVWQYVALHFGFGPPGTRVTVGQFFHDLVVTQVWLAVPVGLLAASLSVWNAERAAGGAEWSPFVRRRQRIDQRARDRRTARLLARPRDTGQARLPWASPWTATCAAGGRAATSFPWPSCGQGHGRGRSPGAGKTVTLLRLAYLRACWVARCFATRKAPTPPWSRPDRCLSPRQPQARIGCWPTTAMDMWRGSPAQVQSRLLAVEQFTEPFYQRVASAGLRLALTALDMPPVEGSDELLRRLDVDELGALWEAPPLQLKDIEAIGEHLPGARLRYADFFAALAGAFDRGSWSYEDVDLAVLTVPTCCPRARRMRRCGWSWRTTATTPPAATPPGEDALLILDEFSALASGVDAAINLAERVRDVGVQVVVAAQSVEGLGDHRQAPRLLASCAGGIVVQQCPDPERLLRWPGRSGCWSTTGSWTSTAPAASPRPAWGAAKDRPRGRPPPNRRGLGHPGRPVHPPAGPGTARRPEAGRAGGHAAGRRHHPATSGRGADSGRDRRRGALAGRMVRRVGQRTGRRQERGGRLPSPTRRPWLPRPLPGRGRR